jgi:hypothetical protein
MAAPQLNPVKPNCRNQKVFGDSVVLNYVSPIRASREVIGNRLFPVWRHSSRRGPDAALKLPHCPETGVFRMRKMTQGVAGKAAFPVWRRIPPPRVSNIARG